MSESKVTVEEQIEALAIRSGKFKADAYRYALQVISDVFTLKKAITPTDEPISLPAREVLRGLKTYGWMYYGLLAKHVFEAWGLHHGRDFGEIVFDLVDADFIGKSPDESIADYDKGFDFDFDVESYWNLETNEDVIKHITSYKN